MSLPDVQTLRDQQAASDLSWVTITAAQVRAKVANIEAMPFTSMRAAYARMLAHAVRAHAPAHLPIIPRQWQDAAP